MTVLDFLVRGGLAGFKEADHKIAGHLFGCEHERSRGRCEATVQERGFRTYCRYNCSSCGDPRSGTLWPSLIVGRLPKASRFPRAVL